ncbi:DUF2793 domain-containing protein [Aurantiacibacter arachoides]|uniref:DUF2793 domain-containing protein n=1 Tax=Aurantiacibacter arachoides TaxID=1850444 RepID=UPI0010394BD0|nr:DUF2793 domain-containing protein [Aurantiacibacter arachoides]GGD62795.1 hypothetical protein GCM10011411_23830 [Aurantiacibacter arachoides]
MVSAQAQKEFTINEALARLDTLIHPAIEGEADAPPASPADGETWLVGAAPTGEWAGHAGHLAGRQAGNWVFATPRTGMLAFDKAAGQVARYDDGWHRAQGVALPTGGAVADLEARAAIEGLAAALIAAGIVAG